MVMEIIISAILLLVGIAVLMIIHVCVVGRAFRGHDSVVDGGNSIPIPSMKLEDIIKELPLFHYEAAEDEEKGNVMDCAVCLEIFSAGEKCRILPKCNHIFHAECIDLWLVKTGACPYCRTGAVPIIC